MTFEPFKDIFMYDKSSVVFVLKDNYSMIQLLNDIYDLNNYNQVLLDTYFPLSIRRPNFYSSNPNRYYKKSLTQFDEFINREDVLLHFFDDSFSIEFFIIINKLLKIKNAEIHFYGNQYKISKYWKLSIKFLITKLVLTFYYRIYGLNMIFFWNGYSIQPQWKHRLTVTKIDLESNKNIVNNSTRSFVRVSNKKKLLYLHTSIDNFSFLDYSATYRNVSDFLLKKLENNDYELYFKNHPHFDYVPLEFKALLTKSALIPSYVHPTIIEDDFDEVYTIVSTAIMHFNLQKSFLLESTLVYHRTDSTLRDYLNKNFDDIKRI